MHFTGSTGVFQSIWRTVGERIGRYSSYPRLVGETGGRFGPELTTVGERRDAAWLLKYLPKPQASDPKNKMPPVAVKGQDLDDLVAYLVSLKGKIRGD